MPEKQNALTNFVRNLTPEQLVELSDIVNEQIFINVAIGKLLPEQVSPYRHALVKRENDEIQSELDRTQSPAA